MTLGERMLTIANEQMLMREQHGRARARLSDILEVCDEMNQTPWPMHYKDNVNAVEFANQIADLAIAGLKLE